MDARITSGDGDHAVKTYTRDSSGSITVRGIKSEGSRVSITLEAPGADSYLGDTTGRTEWSKQITPAGPGRYTLVVDAGPHQKELRQQIEVL